MMKRKFHRYFRGFVHFGYSTECTYTMSSFSSKIDFDNGVVIVESISLDVVKDKAK